MARQTADTIMMIRPVSFRLNEETATNNYYQKAIEGLTPDQMQERALAEFDNFVEELRKNGVRVIVYNDRPEPNTPDSIFPNNWITFHDDGRVGLYPMFAPSRREERREDLLESLVDEEGFHIEELSDFSGMEEEGTYLEGTGSMVLDRENKIAYAALSERTDEHALMLFCQEFEYAPVSFTANQSVDGFRLPIYHTNVMMSLGSKVAAICADCIDDKGEKEKVLAYLRETGKEVVLLTEEQIDRFAGNMLEVTNAAGESLMVMSTSAFTALRDEQKNQIEKHSKIVHSSLDTIEALGGGSARCMMAEVFLPKKEVQENA